jgi:small-conductance mechanosensitive channel/CRP-like cAMP-binding protein
MFLLRTVAMEHFLKALGNVSSSNIGLAIAIGLVLTIRLLLPTSDRKLLRQPYFYLGTHLVFRAILFVVDATTPLGKVANFISLGALLGCLGRGAVLLILDVIVHARLKTPIPKIIRDIVQGVVYLAILLAILRAGGVEPGQILTTSALLTAVVGLSLQETLGNLFAGLAVQIQRPFDVGDWIQFDADPRHVGKVVEINWRATKLITLERFELIVPNSLLAKAPLRNYSKPTILVRRQFMIQASYEIPPPRVHQIVLSALADSPLVLTDPAPTVVTNDFKDSGIEYWVRFFINDFDRRDIADGGVRERVWYAFKRANISMPFPHRVIEMHEISEESVAAQSARRVMDRESALANVDFIQVISPDQRKELAERATTRLFSPGELIVKQGDTSAELFIILRGEVAVVFETDKTATEIARLAAGKFFGEMALVTGERRKASVRAARECELLVIDHNAFKRVLEETPAVVEQLSQILADRQIQLDEHAAQATEGDRASAVQEQSSVLLQRIRKWFAISK